MTAPAERHPAFSIVASMESDICDAQMIARLLVTIASSPNSMDCSDLSPITNLLDGIAERLHAQYSAAFDALRRKA